MKCPQCGEELRICFTGKVWKSTCDTEDCPRRDVYDKSKEKLLVRVYVHSATKEKI